MKIEHKSGKPKDKKIKLRAMLLFVLNASRGDTDLHVLPCARKISCQKHKLSVLIWGIITRKLGFDNCVSDTYHTKLQSSVIKACSTVRHLVFRATLFVNYYVLENHALTGAPKVIFSQNFWYSIIQMLNGKRPTNSASLPQQLLNSSDQFKRQHRSFLYTEKLLPGISQCVTEACKELATSYTNNIVENFENHLLYFLRYKLQDLFMVS